MIEKIFNFIKQRVMEEYNITEQDLMCSKSEQCSDARYVIVVLASRYYSDTEIATALHRTRQGISSIKSNFSRSKKWLIQQVMRSIQEELKQVIVK